MKTHTENTHLITHSTSSISRWSRLAIRELKKVAAGAALALGALTTIHAQENNQPWEARLIFGFDSLDSTTVTATSPEGTSTADVDFGSGTALGFSVGYNLPNNLLLELDYVYRTSDEDTLPDAMFGTGTTIDASSVMISPNLWYKPTWNSAPQLKPRFGIGLAWMQEVSSDVMLGGVENSFDGDGTGFKLMAGIDWEVSDRWLVGVDATLYDAGSIDATSETIPGQSIEFDYSGLTFNLGATYRF